MYGASGRRNGLEGDALMTQDTRAFELREDIDAELFGGSVTLSTARHYDVAAALAEGDGKIVTDDERT
jgi:hypothetical protein